MSVLSRIARMLRAGFRDIFEPADPAGRSKKSGRNDYYQADAKDYRQSDYRQRQGNSHQDPKLAQYYANLEVPYGSDLATVQAAWKRLAKQYHPDMHSHDPEKQKIANDILQQLNLAHDELRKHLQS